MQRPKAYYWNDFMNNFLGALFPDYSLHVVGGCAQNNIPSWMKGE